MLRGCTVLISRRDQTGLFSVLVVTFLLITYPLLQANPADTTNQLLSQILSSNGTASSQPLSPADGSSFQPQFHVVCVNAFLFTSLLCSLACALWATLMQQWARRFSQAADIPDVDYTPSQRAQIYIFFLDGISKFGFLAAVEVLPALLHGSIFLFLLGLTILLFYVDHLVAYIYLGCWVIGLSTYSVLTIMPFVFPNSPYETPLSSILWVIIETTSLLAYWLPFRDNTLRAPIRERWANIRLGMHHARELKAIKSGSQASPKIQTTQDHDEDYESEEFLLALPGIFHSSDRLYLAAFRRGSEQLVEQVTDKLLSTCMNGPLSDELRTRRLKTCLSAIWCFSGTVDRHFRAIREQCQRNEVTNDHPWGPLSKETWTVAGKMTTDSDPSVAVRARCIQALMAVMWKKNIWQCTWQDAAELLRPQLELSSDDDINRWNTGGDQLQLAIAANLLSKSLPLLQTLEVGVETTVKMELKWVLNTICRDLDAFDAPDELRDRFIDCGKVMKAFRLDTVDFNEPWTKIFKTHGPDV